MLRKGQLVVLPKLDLVKMWEEKKTQHALHPCTLSVPEFMLFPLPHLRLLKLFPPLPGSRPHQPVWRVNGLHLLNNNLFQTDSWGMSRLTGPYPAPALCLAPIFVPHVFERNRPTCFWAIRSHQKRSRVGNGLKRKEKKEVGGTKCL